MEPRLTGAVLVAETALVDPGAVAVSAGARIYCPSRDAVDEEQVRLAQAAGARVLPWTANTAEQWQRLLDCGVDGITTDYPDRLAKFLRDAGVAY
jgi:glycerophosphoryl diester phosphodiesterase